MKKHSKLLVLVLSLALIIGAVAIVASADNGNVCKIGSKEYATLEEAISAAQNGDVIKLISDASISTSQQKPISFDVDLQGYTLYTNCNNALSGNSTNTIRIVGEGLVIAKGTLLNNAGYSQNANMQIVGSGKGIKVIHTGEVSTMLVSSVRGKFHFENADIEVNTKTKGQAIYCGSIDNSGNAAQHNKSMHISFKNCVFNLISECTTEATPAFYLKGTDASLKIEDSYFNISSRLVTPASAWTTENPIVIENSTIVQKATPYLATMKTCMFGGTGPVNPVVIKDSTLGFRYRFVESPSFVINLDNSVLYHNGEGIFN